MEGKNELGKNSAQEDAPRPFWCVPKPRADRSDTIVPFVKRLHGQGDRFGRRGDRRPKDTKNPRLPTRDRKRSDHNRKGYRAFPTAAPDIHGSTIYKMAARIVH
ncbi:hypothetical protein Bbelb_175120 [Branchiostoma belcheri]|nr:hypothetical protein Bbelb_175120 [Branchiostoma belcheri]